MTDKDLEKAYQDDYKWAMDTQQSRRKAIIFAIVTIICCIILIFMK
jgi:hypothetical protein